MKPYRLCVLGNNSGRNAGDAAILSSIVRNLLARSPDVAFEVPTIRPAHIREAFAGLPVRPVSTLPWTLSLRILGPTTMLSIMRSDAVLITDAIIFDYRLLNPVFNYLILLAGVIPFARLCGKKIVCFCVGIGPLDRPLGRRITRMICSLSDAIMVREESSRELLEAIGVPPERLREIWADVAFVNPPAPPERGREILAAHGVAPGEPLLGVNVNAYLDKWLGSESSLDRDGFIAAVARGLDDVIGRCGVRVAFVITQVMDVGIAEEIRARMAHRERVPVISNRDLTNQEIMAVLGHMSLFAGMRLHSLILAAAMHAPVVPLAYAPKVRHFARMLGLAGETFEFAGFTAERFADALAAAWERREATRARLLPAVEAAKGRARAAFDAFVERFIIAPGSGAAGK
jgi:polysaccharide pyruvyl transferase WcaK-like protein